MATKHDVVAMDQSDPKLSSKHQKKANNVVAQPTTSVSSAKVENDPKHSSKSAASSHHPAKSRQDDSKTRGKSSKLQPAKKSVSKTTKSGNKKKKSSYDEIVRKAHNKSMREEQTELKSLCCGVTLRNSNIFVAFIAVLVFAKSYLETYFISVFDHIQNRYGFTRTEMEFAVGTEKIGFVMCLIIAAYYGRNTHKPLVIFVGSWLCAVGSVVSWLPYFVSESRMQSNLTQTLAPLMSYLQAGLCLSGENQNISDAALYQCDVVDLRHDEGAFSLLCFGKYLVGLGFGMYASLSLVYINDAGTQHNLPLLLGIILCLHGFGEMVASLMSWQLDDYSENMKYMMTFPDWEVGAWWVGLPVGAGLFILASFILIFYPKWLSTPRWLALRRRRRLRRLEVIVKKLEAEEDAARRRRQRRRRRKRREERKAKKAKEEQSAAEAGGSGGVEGAVSNEVHLVLVESSKCTDDVTVATGDGVDETDDGRRRLDNNNGGIKLDINIDHDGIKTDKGDGNKSDVGDNKSEEGDIKSNEGDNKSDEDDEKSDQGDDKSDEDDKKSDEGDDKSDEGDNKSDDDGVPKNDVNKAHTSNGLTPTPSTSAAAKGHVVSQEKASANHISFSPKPDAIIPHSERSVGAKEKKKGTRLGRQFKHIPQNMWFLLRQPMYSVAVLGAGLSAYLSSGYQRVLPEFMDAYFHQSSTPHTAVAAVCHGVGTSIGAIVGGVFLWRFTRKSPIEGQSLFLKVMMVSLALHVAMLMLMLPTDCDGVASLRNVSATSGKVFHAECNSQCDCSGVQLSPVCSQMTRFEFPSACHAGCTAMAIDPEAGQVTYSSCSCVPYESLSSAFCQTSCQSLPIFLSFYTIAVIAHSSAYVAVIMYFLSLVKTKMRSLSLGLAIWLITIISMPGVTVFKAIADVTCIENVEDCLEQAVCWLQDTTPYKYRTLGALLGFQLSALVCFIVVYFSQSWMRSLVEEPGQKAKNLKEDTEEDRKEIDVLADVEVGGERSISGGYTNRAYDQFGNEDDLEIAGRNKTEADMVSEL